MNNINVNTRIKHKIDTEANWNQHSDFLPLKGEIIIYDVDDTHAQPRIKIGTGNAYLIDLPFINKIELQHLNNTDIHITTAERAFWNNKVSCGVDQSNQTIIFSTD